MAPLTSSAINKSKTVAPKAVARRRPAAPPPKPQAAPKSPVAETQPEQDVVAAAARTPPLSQATLADPPLTVKPISHEAPSRSEVAENAASVLRSASVEQPLPTPPPTQQSEAESIHPVTTPGPATPTQTTDVVDPVTVRPTLGTAASPTLGASRHTPTAAPTPSPLRTEPATEDQSEEVELEAEREGNTTEEGPVTTAPERPTSLGRETPRRESSEIAQARLSASPGRPSPTPVAGTKRKRGALEAAQPSPSPAESTGETIQADATADATAGGASQTQQDSDTVAGGDQQTDGEERVSADQQTGTAPDRAAPKPTKPRAKRQKKAAVPTESTDGQVTSEEGQTDATTLTASAKPKAKPRAKKTPKSAARVIEDEDGNVIDEPEPAPAKEKPPRKPRQRKPKKTPEQAAAGAEGSESENPELHEIDAAATTMSHLTRDRRLGKTSEREVKMAAIDWPEVIRKRQEAADAIARGAATEPEGGEKLTEGTEGAGEGERDGETPGPRPAISGPRLRLDADGNLVVDETSLRIDRQAQAEANAANLQVTEEDDLTQRVNRMSWIGNRKKEPTERLPFFKMKSDPWSDEETDRFFEALRMFGTDFFIISKMFVPKTRRQIKLKFIREERLDASRVNRALAGEDTAMSLEHFAEATGQDIENFKDPRLLEEELRVEGEEQREEIALKKKEIEEAKKQRDVQMAAREKDTAKRQAQKKQKAQARANRRRGVFGTGTF